jgi:predicted dehydrogenase
MKKVKAGIIGCGKVSHTHAKILLTNERAELVAVYDVAADKGKDFRERPNNGRATRSTS